MSLAVLERPYFSKIYITVQETLCHDSLKYKTLSEVWIVTSVITAVILGILLTYAKGESILIWIILLHKCHSHHMTGALFKKIQTCSLYRFNCSIPNRVRSDRCLVRIWGIDVNKNRIMQNCLNVDFWTVNLIADLFYIQELKTASTPVILYPKRSTVSYFYVFFSTFGY